MFKSTDELLRRLNAAGWSERRNLEFKSGEKWDDLKMKLAKAALAMSNIEGGGYIVVGVSRGKDGQPHVPEGMPGEAAQTYGQDEVSEYINTFADPHIDVEVRRFEHEGRFLVAIKVHEFASEPVICKRDGPDVQRGVLYYRGHRMPESSPVASSAEARDIIDRDVDRAFERQHRRLRSYPPQERDRFEEEQGEASPPEAEEVMKEILERGYWEIRIRPVAYPDPPHQLRDLEDLLLKSRVRHRGWHYPHVSQSQYGRLYRLNGCIEARVRWSEFAEVLRFYASGQFVQYVGMAEDRYGDAQSPLVPWDPSRRSPRPRQPFLNPVSALYYLTEIYLFAAKIAKAGVLGDEILVETALHGQDGRVLRSESRPLMFTDSDRCSAPVIRLGPHRVGAEELRADHDGMAVRDARVLMEKYGAVDESMEKALQEWQVDFYRRSF